MMPDHRLTCTKCGKDFHWLEEFPGCVCLQCWEAANINTTLAEFHATITNTFGGNTSKRRKQ